MEETAVVVGLGNTGSQAIRALTGLGFDVIGLDSTAPPSKAFHARPIATSQPVSAAQFGPRTGIDSLGYAERVAERSGVDLFQRTGVLVVRPPAGRTVRNKGDLVDQSSRFAKAFWLNRCETLSGAEAMQRFDGLDIDPECRTFFDPMGGSIDVDALTTVRLTEAMKDGAALHYGDSVTELIREGNRTRVVTECTSYLADRVIVATGRSLSTLFPNDRRLQQLRTSVIDQSWWTFDNNSGLPPFYPDFPVIDLDFGIDLNSGGGGNVGGGANVRAGTRSGGGVGFGSRADSGLVLFPPMPGVRDDETTVRTLSTSHSAEATRVLPRLSQATTHSQRTAEQETLDGRPFIGLASDDSNVILASASTRHWDSAVGVGAAAAATLALGARIPRSLRLERLTPAVGLSPGVL